MTNPRIEEKKQFNKNIISKEVLLKPNDQIFSKSLVDQTWWTIDNQIIENILKIKPKSPVVIPNLKSFQRTKAIRIFVSSTFTDFFNERELLVKFVFPELREWCHKRNMDLIECDLRWGVPADSTNEDTILTCLSELDRCLNENDGQPFFIGMLGDKYGWVPDSSSLQASIKQTYNWVPNISITHMEFLHGAIRCRNKNACFFIRDSLKEIPEEYRNKFYESDPISKSQLTALKRKLRQYFPDQVFSYSCEYDKIDDTTGRKKVKLKNFKNFCEKALDFLTNSIQKMYPNSGPINILENSVFISNEVRAQKLDIFFKDELSYQDLFVVEMTNFFVGYEKQLDLFIDKILNHDSGLVIGERGSGKTSFLAMAIKKLFEKNIQNIEIFYHFADSSAFSRYHRAFVTRFIYQYQKLLNLEDEVCLETAFDSSSTSNSFKKLLEILSQRKTKLLILIDGFELEKRRDYFELINLSCLFKNIIFVFTCTPEKSSEFDFDNYFEIVLNGFDQNQSRNFIKNFLQKYNKRLDDVQMNLILEKSSQSKLPLWLNCVCNELRVFGEFTTINRQIQNFSTEISELIRNVIKRINSDFSNDIIKEILCLIHLTRNGIPENEISLLLSSCGFDTNRLECAHIIRNLKFYLKFTYYQNIQLITLNTNYVGQVIVREFLQNNETHYSYHKKLINFYRNISKYRSLSCLELCYHYKIISNKKQLAEYLKTNEASVYLNSSYKSFLYKDLRCRFLANKNTSTNLKICLSCSNKIGFLSQNSPNKNSCFVCGSFFTVSSKLVYTCIKHFEYGLNSDNFFKCCLCKKNYQKPKSNSKIQMVFDANLCNFCSDLNCCMLELE